MQHGLMEYLDASVVANSGSGDKLKTWLEETGVTSLSGGMMTMTNLAPSDPPSAPPTTTNGPEEGDFTRMLLGSLSLGSSDDFSLPPRAYHQNPPPIPTNPYDLPLLQPQQPFQLSQHQFSSQTQALPPPPPMFNVPRDLPIDQQLQFQLEHLRAAQQQHHQEHQRAQQQTQVYQQQPQSDPQLRPSTRDSPTMMYMTPLQPIMLPSFGGYYANLTPAPAQPTFSRIPYMNMEQQLPLHPVPIQPAPARPSIDYKECTFAHFSPKGEEPAEISPNANLGSSVNDKGEGGTVAPLEILYQPFYQPDYSDDDLDFGSGGSFDAGDGRRDTTRKVKGEKGREKGSSDSEWESEGESEERPTFPFILKLATKRREEEHMRFGFALDPHIRGKGIQLTIKEEILQRPPRKEKTSSKNKSKTDSDAGNGGGSRGRGRAAGKKAKVKESAKEDPHILFRGRLESGTSGTAEMRASSVHGLMTPLHWVLDRQELTLNFKAAEGSGMNIIRYQFHVQPVDTAPSPTEQQYINDPTRPARYVAMSVPAIICSHSTSQFQRALLALIHYHFHNQDRVASEDILACFELLAGGSFKQFKEAFATFPLPAGSPVLRGTDVPAVLEWFLASWRIFSVDNYMALYKLGYVHGFLGRDQAQDLLKFQEEGVFLIRIGSNGLSMSIKYGGQIMPVEIDPNTLKQISITVAADSAVRLLCRDGSKLPKETLIQAITAIPRFGYASVARLASLAKERQESSIDGRNGDEGEHKRKR